MTNKVLIITHKEDYTADYLINILNKRKLDYIRFNCEDLNKKSYSINSLMQFKFQEENQFKSVWFRRTKFPVFDNIKPEIQYYLAEEYDILLKNLFTIIDSKWLSNPFEIYKSENKLFQLKIAREIGFNVPDTLVTNSKDQLLDFYSKHNEKVIIKPLSQSKFNSDGSTTFLFSNILQKQHIVDLDFYELTPCIFQEQIDKEIEIRVTVVGENIFAAAVNSQDVDETKIDWRKGDLIFYEVEIPYIIREQCFELVRKLNLRFGAIDMILNKQGNYIFLEINPNGQWAWIENQTKQPISEAIINELYFL